MESKRMCVADRQTDRQSETVVYLKQMQQQTVTNYLKKRLPTVEYKRSLLEGTSSPLECIRN